MRWTSWYRLHKSHWPLLLGLILVARVLPAGQNQQQTNNASAPVIKTNVRQILVPILVTDKKGHPVSNLQQSEFTVLEDEAPQQIVAFRKTYDASLEARNLSVAGSGTATPSVGTPFRVGKDSPTRTYMVCVDMLHSGLGNLDQARRALAKFFRQEHDEQAQYALLNLSRKIEVIQDSTRDPSLVLSALESKRFQSSVLDSEASGLALNSEQLRRMLESFAPQSCNAPTVRVRGTIQDNCSAMKLKVKMFINSSAERTALLTRSFLQDLTNIINAMGDTPTERTLILISDGFNLVPGRELFGIASSYFPNELEWRSNQRDTQPELNELLRLAQKQNVVIDTLDSRGVYSAASQGGNYDAANSGQGSAQSGPALNEMDRQADTAAWEKGSPMAQLAEGTGGFYFHNNNHLLSGLHRAFDDGRERYQIAYSPSNVNFDGRYRKIQIKVKSKNLRVYAKAGYWASAN